MQPWQRAFQFQHWNQKHYLLAVFAFSSFLLISFSVVLYRQSSVVERHDKWVLHSYEVLRKARRVYTHALDVETGQRGYLLTGTQVFLAPYKKATLQLDVEVENLRTATIDNPNQQQSIRLLRDKLDELLLLLNTQIKLYEHSGIQALSKKDLMDSRAAMDAVRGQLDVITSDELGLLRERMSLSRKEQKNYVTTLFVGSGLAIGGLLLANMIIFSLLTHTKKTEARLRSFEERLRLVMEGVNDGIFEYDPQRRITEFSPNYIQLIGYSPEELNGDVEKLDRLIHPDDLARQWEAVEHYLQKQTSTFSEACRIRHRDGSWRWFLTRGVAVWDHKGRPLRLIGTHSDITEQKQHEEQLKQMNEELESFAYIASHDLRSPLVNLKGFAGEIDYALEQSRTAFMEAAATLPPEKRRQVELVLEKDIPESLGYIHAAVEKMDVLTTAILDMSRIGRREYRNQTVDLDPLLKRCLDALAFEISSKHITVDVEPMPTIESDPVVLEQIFGNILDNAIKYLRPEIPGHIRIFCQVLEHGYEFHISDNGRGISAQDRAKVFDIFRRASNVGDVRGAGMGMAYVKALIRKLGGRIWFSSAVNEGTVFSFVLPARMPTPPHQYITRFPQESV